MDNEQFTNWIKTGKNEPTKKEEGGYLIPPSFVGAVSNSVAAHYWRPIIKARVKWLIDNNRAVEANALMRLKLS